ncbi:siroheme synthase CysG [Congregibacter sp.]|jgi:uroporphyrin-III C-methyltransferase/precorrin-2 dehydrogenase/sirohydrochlorin ferrochelatase|uniref:siroheme synthase CysG n=1 Tax=Congregibacter sp. TaxID=2744308 RepID=UPI0039E32C40
MDFLPINLRLRDQPVVLVGAGVVAARKARFLLGAGAQLTVIAPEQDSQFRALADEQPVTWHAREYVRGDLAGAIMVIAATPDRTVNEAVHAEATARGIPVNVVDSPDLCSFIFPAIVDRSPLIVAISSSGASPVLARSVRSRIEAMLPAATADIARFGRLHRDRIREVGSSEAERRRIWEQVIDGPIAQLILNNRWQAAEQALAELLENHSDLPVGEVYLIGAGPGDPELMTFKALRLLQRADIVLHDRLVNPDIVAMARRDADKLYVGKRRSDHSVPQDRINELLVELAQQGKRVARLKGGDPFVFGRGGEEIELLAEKNIPFQVVPGITAGNAAACYAGIPLTHRDYAQSVRFVTGHTKDGKLQHRWEEFLSETETLVFYMGLVGLPIICKELMAHGRSPDTAIALIERATSPSQRLLTGTLGTIESLVESAKPQPPTLIIVGKVVDLAERLRWYGSG